MFGKSTKKALSVVLILGLVLSLFTGCAKKEPDVIKIGAIYPLTGDGAFYGENAKNALLLAKQIFVGENFLKDINWELIIEDSKSNPKDAVNAANKIIFKDKVKFIIGDAMSSNFLAIAPIAEKNKVIEIGQGSNPKISDAGDYIFRTWPSDELQGKVIAKFIEKNLNAKQIGILHIANEYGSGVADVVKKEYQGEIAMIEAYPSDTRDFKDIIKKLMALKIDCLVLIPYVDELPTLFKQLNEYGWKIPIVGSEQLNTERVVKNPYISFTVYYTYPLFGTEENTEYKKFVEKYRDVYKKQPDIPADAVYDAIMLILKAIDNVGYDVEKVKNFLYNIKNYDGASGKITFDGKGDVIKPFIVKKIEKGRAVEIEVISEL